MMSDPILSLKDASLSLNGNAGVVKILRGITLDVQQGETVGLVGPSGSGKSSLLMLMGGLEQATGGTVCALGHDLTTMNEDALARFRRDHMGVVFQSFHLIPTMTALENTATPLELAGVRDAFDRAMAELETVGLGQRANHYPGQLSGGEQQRVALARAIALDPMMIMYDEPFAGQDPISMGVLVKLIRQLNDAAELTSIVVSHDVKETSAIADLLYVISDGRVVESGDPGSLWESGSEWTRQFMHGLPDGPVPFHFPAPPLQKDLFGEQA